jgi:hypothetical protein
MPRNVRGSYPHPCVGIGDDIEGALTCSTPGVDVGLKTTSIVVDNVQCSNPTIQKHIASGEAHFALRIECGATMFRHVVKGSESSLLATLRVGALSGTVHLELEVWTAKNIDDYRPLGLHQDYGDAKFSLENGTVLAVGPTYAFEVASVYEELDGAVSSIVRVQLTDDNDVPIRVSYSSDLITIFVSKADQPHYAKMADVLPGVVHSALVFPALVEAIRRVRAGDPDTDDCKWFKRLSRLLDQYSSDCEPFETGMLMLNNPFRRAAASVRTILAQDDQ